MPCTPPPGGVDARQVDAGQRGTVRVPRGVGRSTVCRSVGGPAADVAAEVVGYVLLHPRRRCGPLARIRSRKPGANRSICASMRADMSTSEPRGTWQYPHSVCCPAGARLGSTTPAWAIKAERALRVTSGCHVGLGRRYLGERAAEVYGASLPAGGGPARAPARRAPSRPCRRRGRTGTAAAPAATWPGAGHPRARRAGVGHIQQHRTCRCRSRSDVTQRGSPSGRPAR